MLEILILGFVATERLAELVLARRNTARLLARGAREVAPGHYPLIVALHTIWLVSLWGFAWGKPIHPGWFATFLLLQVGRFWVLATLKDRWTTRIIVLPGARMVDKGPYRFLKHPNYAVVAGEIAVLPLVFGLPWFALTFSIVNAMLLSVRIRAENAALAERDISDPGNPGIVRRRPNASS
jgi:methyltransferase